MDTHFICLANSYKRGGRCIAGIEISVSDDNRWSVLRNADGSPRWIRPIAKDTEFGEIPEGEARFIHLFSVVKLTNIEPCPGKAHSEDVHYLQMQTIGLVPPSASVLDLLTDNSHHAIFYTTDFSISKEIYEQGDYSLMMVHPDGFQFHLDPTKDRARYKMIFRYLGSTYEMPVTDPAFYRQLELSPDLLDNLQDAYLTLSLGLEYEGCHHKLIAAVIIPTMTKTNEPFIICQNTLYEKSVRPFTRAERRACKRAFVVPSQAGPSVCFKMKNGQEHFILLEANTSAKEWQTINLKRAQIVTYEDSQGKEEERIRFVSRTRWFQKLGFILKAWVQKHWYVGHSIIDDAADGIDGVAVGGWNATSRSSSLVNSITRHD